MTDALDRVWAMLRQQSATDSPAAWLASHPHRRRQTILETLELADLLHLEYAWPFWARPEQMPPDGTWRFWLFNGGRGAGKTRAGAEWVRRGAERGDYQRIALVAPTMEAGRHVMIEGPAGLLAVCPPWARPTYEPSRHELRWPNGAIATLYSADAPERLRGPQHEAFWADELCTWRDAQYTWDMLLLGLRLGDDPRGIVTTTPRVMPLFRRLLEDPTVTMTTASTFRNAANLAPDFLQAIVDRYQGTRLGRQELHAELIEDIEGALWQRDWIEAHRVTAAPALTRILVAVDPAVTGTTNAHETGIIVAGLDAHKHVYVLADESLRGSPDAWAQRVVAAYDDHQADVIVAEANQGGDLVSLTLRTADRNVPIRSIHASRGKRTRAEPVSALYEQGRVHHVGAFPDLEDQLCLWDATSGEGSPDRLDALVWAVTELAVVGQIPLDLITTPDHLDVDESDPEFQRLLAAYEGRDG